MVIAPIAAAAAPVVVQSATDENGLINQAFKLTILIGLALAVGVGIFLIWKLTPLFADLITVVTDVTGAISSTIGLAGTIATAIISATPLGRGFTIFKKLF
jgi:hypothetical protein